MSRRSNNHFQQYHDDQQSLEIHMGQFEDRLEQLLRNAQNQEEDRKRQQLDAVKRWLDAPIEHQSDLHQDCTDKRNEYPGTTSKTILTSGIIDYCKEYQPEDRLEDRPDYKTSYFYCRENVENNKECLEVYKALLHQMLHHHPDMLPSCYEKKLNGMDVLGDTSTAEILIRRFCEADFNQFIIIDGLDEIESRQRKMLMNFLANMVDECDKYDPGKVRVLFVSHDLADVRRMKRMETATILDLNPHDTQRAIKRYLVSMDYRLYQLRDDIREICGSLVQKVHNRIRFAHQTAREYIVNNEELDEKRIECDLTILCLSYLAAPWFRRNLGDADREWYIKAGYFSFQDYALSKWSHHLKAFVQTGPDLCARPLEGPSYLNRVSRALANFVQAYLQDLNPPEHEEQITTATEQCLAFRDCAFYEDLVMLWTHLYRHQHADLKQRNKVGISSLDSALEKNRKKLEGLVAGEGGDVPAELPSRYGDYIFKCDRLLCDYFHVGFGDKEARQAHLNRHERPYPCTVEGCSVVVFGFSNNKDRDKHMRLYHPDEAEGSGSGFIQMPRELVGEAKFPCSNCPKIFTRKANRDAHVRSHFGDRPFECPSCDRAFTRKNDLRRHERKKHVRGRG
ncbi:hypothetical protein SLS62_007231 [Diatrype stigma]|uniref:C2H2-type domain-containing protein n=1 Tax=Diatrype stigma TaxID=117547 RepID=A0AAN9UPC4_9PEZI